MAGSHRRLAEVVIAVVTDKRRPSPPITEKQRNTLRHQHIISVFDIIVNP